MKRWKSILQPEITRSTRKCLITVEQFTNVEKPALEKKASKAKK